ncbi:unnamed protein product [Rotaria socialis]|uniref:non-specific serine/threonine protein kinase n=1 Tax=Rotaria socialis TaxID=392032 RepID=A0A820KV52_9BILA|nr:unnamed protein product [Rotaria socialis]CAF3436669.1 unnamed protein product [Rotaria socialis]CAF3449579.1 unnamed protein product [Rotaria socialis]CAF3463173.1 unnamed protein product [Rotaria socialis]CAF4109870.1 unnamed protein product [Rotaria socialis]
MTENEEPQIFKKRYKIVKKLGAGNFGTAYLVTDLEVRNEPKVLKVVRLGEMDADQTVDSVREAELLSNLHNEHIVKFYESFLENDYLCIVTEFCEGGDLDQRFKQLKKENHTLEEDQVVEWLIQILIAVQYMHKSRILHRDLKARNIFLKSNKVKIGDFGISRILVGTMDVASTFTGTPYYMSPEVMKHDGYESKSDIWSVGCLLYEMCTYQHAFDGKGLMNVIYKVVEGQPPELPKTYSKELNDLSKKMFAKDPKQRPSAAELLQSTFILQHRQRIQMNAPLETTISGNHRLKNIHARLQSPMNYGEMQKQNWSLSSPNHTIKVEDVDDDNDVQLGNNTFYKCNLKTEEEEDNDEEQQQQTLKEGMTQKTAKQTMIERKLHQADARAQEFAQAVRSQTLQAAQSRQMMRDSTICGSMQQPWPSPSITDKKEQARSKLAQTYNSHNRKPNQYSNDETYAVRPPADRLNNFNKSLRTKATDDRPITPMRGTYRQIADQFGDEDGLPIDPTLTNQYYEAYNDFEKEDDFSPTREQHEKEFYEQVCRSFNGQERTNDRRRVMSASRSSTMNSLSRTIDERFTTNQIRPSKYITSSRTVAGATKQRTLSNRTVDENNSTLKDNPIRDAYGPLAKNRKLTSLRTKAIEALGEETFEKVHNYLIKQRSAQRTDLTLDDSKITQGLTAFVKKPSDCFLVDQLVFLELVAN